MYASFALIHYHSATKLNVPRHVAAVVCASADTPQVQLAAVQNSGQFVDSGAGKVSSALLSCFWFQSCCASSAFNLFHAGNFAAHAAHPLIPRVQVQERSMAADSERAYEAFVSHQMGGGAPPK
jgi:hypothetical protein